MWVFATRSRFSNCVRFLESWIKTSASSPVYVRMDEDDPELDRLLKLPWPPEFELVVGPQARIGQAMNEMFNKYPNEPWYGIMADDQVPKTDCWDQRLIEAAIPDQISYADDVYEKRTRICHPCIGGDLVRTVGFFSVPTVRHFGTDTFWEQLHHSCGKNGRLPDVIVEHAHVNFNQAPNDATYIRSQTIRQEDKFAFKAYMNEHFETIMSRIEAHHPTWKQVKKRTGGWV
jgi:hypothetical protein